jgi:hypothetical protein
VNELIEGFSSKLNQSNTNVGLITGIFGFFFFFLEFFLTFPINYFAPFVDVVAPPADVSPILVVSPVGVIELPKAPPAYVPPVYPVKALFNDAPPTEFPLLPVAPPED